MLADGIHHPKKKFSTKDRLSDVARLSELLCLECNVNLMLHLRCSGFSKTKSISVRARIARIVFNRFR